MAGNPWKLDDAEREEHRAALRRHADLYRALRDSPGFVRTYPHCFEDLIIQADELAEVEVGTILVLLLNLLRMPYQEPSDRAMWALMAVAADYVDDDGDLLAGRRREFDPPGRN